MSYPQPDGIFVEAFLVSALVVSLAEIGDKTQILSFMLAARFQRPVCNYLRHLVCDPRQPRGGRLGRDAFR